MASLKYQAMTGVGVCALFTLCGLPVCALFLSASDRSIEPLLSTHSLLLVTTALTTVGALLAAVLGACLAIIVSQLRRSRQYLALGLLSIPLWLPNYVLAIAWSAITVSTLPMGNAMLSITKPAVFSTLWVWTFSLYPISMLTTYFFNRSWPQSLVEGALSNGIRPSREWRIRGAYLARIWVCAVVVTWFVTISDFAVPDYFRVPVFSTVVFAQMASYLDPAPAARMSLPLLVAVGICIVVLATLSKRIALPDWRQSVPVRGSGGHNDLIATLAVVAVVAGVVTAPILLLIRMVNGWNQFYEAWTMVRADCLQSLLLAGAVVICALAVGVPVARIILPVRRPSFLAVRALPMLAFATPASLWGIAVILIWNRPGLAGMMYTSGAAAVLALAGKYVVIVVEATYGQLAQLPTQYQEAGLANGASPIAVFRDVEWPLVRGAIILSSGVLFVWALNDLTIPTLVAPPGVSTLPLRIFSTVHYGPASLLAALCLWQLLLTGTLLLGVAGCWSATGRAGSNHHA